MFILRNTLKYLLIAISLVGLHPSPALAIDLTVDFVALDGGPGLGVDDHTDRYGVAVGWDWDKRWFPVGNWYLGGYSEVNISYWDGEKGFSDNDSLVDFGTTNVLRWQTDTPVLFTSLGTMPYIEGGLGLHVTTDDEIGNKNFSIPFTFGNRIGVGTRFGQQGHLDLGYRFEHLSNAGLGESNPGINFHQVRLGYYF